MKKGVVGWNDECDSMALRKTMDEQFLFMDSKKKSSSGAHMDMEKRVTGA